MNYYELMKAAAIAVGRGGGSKDSGFVGGLQITSNYFDVDIGKLELVYNESSALDNYAGRYIAPTTAFHYSGAWEWCITYRPKYITSDTVCLLGTAEYGEYYANPSIELQNNHNQLWFGLSSNGTSWTGGFTINILTLSEPITVGTAYSFIVGSDATGKGYAKFINADTGVVLSEKTGNNQFHGTNPSAKKAFLLGNAMATRFYFAGDVILSKTYYKEDGVVLWGGK